MKTGEKGAEFREYVLRAFDELCALADQAMTAARQRAVDRAGNGEDLASLLGCQPRRDQRAARERRLHDQRPHREPADDAIATRKVLRQRRNAGGKLRDECASRRDLARERRVLRRIDAFGAATLHRDRATLSRERTTMARGVDAEREPAGDREPGACEVRGKLGGRVAADRGRVAGADHGELRQAEDPGVALDEEHERGVGNGYEQARILGRAVADDPAVAAREPALVACEPCWLRIPERIDRCRRQSERREGAARFAREQPRILA